MYVHKPKDTDKHEHFIEHLVYIVVHDNVALHNAPAVVESDGDPAQGELISRSLPLPPLVTVRKKTKMTIRVIRGSNSLTWARIPSFTVNRDLLDHKGHYPFAPYHVLPVGALLCVLPQPTPFSVMPSSSNECHSIVSLVVVLLV
ncbi:hypothetical protein B296_00050060 [Ensete ventricosum]|uniref:Uncharacterized protein n=1 Tax=Ensete ventricosum TaxID=4639 RepID=A0A426XCR8_ENSVE|nr:hypothetical protein B296_00050060 [Ensete ventricosum]